MHVLYSLAEYRMNKESALRRMDMVAFILTKNDTAYCTVQTKIVHFFK